MNEEAILLLYNDLKESYDVGSIDDFKNYLMDDNKKQMFFEEVIKPTYNVDDIETFNEVYGLKKKEESTFVAPKKDVELVTEDTSLDTQETPETTEYQPQNILEPIESEDAEFEASLKTSVTPDQIKNPEEFVVPEMQYKFGKYGFDFEESTTNVLGTDAMRVKVRGTNKDLYVNLDRLWGKKGTSKELEKFLRENKRKESEILKQSQAIVQNQRTIQTDEELNASIKLFNKESERFVYEANEYAKSKAKLDSIYDSNFSNVSKELIKNNPVLKANYDEWLKESKQLDAKLKEIEGKSKDFKYKGTKLDKIAGDYTAMKAEQGTWWSGFWNEIAGGSGPTFTPISSLIDLGTYLDEKMIMGDDTDASVPVKTRKEEYKKDIIRIAKEKGLAPEGLNEDMSLDEVVKALGGDTNDVKLFFDSIVTKGFLNTPSMARARAMKTGSTKGGTQEKEETNFDIVQDKLLDIERKTKKYYEPKVDPSDPEGKRLISARERAFTDAMSDDPKFRNPFSVVGAQKDNFGNEGMVSAGRDSFNFLKDKSTTEQWAEVQKQGNFLKKGFLGLGGSLPAMLGTSTPVGWAQRTAQMYNMSTDYVDQEMEKNPMFDKISEAEKTLVKMPIGVATAVLENIGLRNIISQKGLLNSLVSKALRKSNKNTTAKTFQEFIRQDIESMIGRGALVITGAGLAEFETGLAQEISTIGIKDVYNASKESKMFETPETFATYMSQVVEAGLAEMVGGFVMGSIPAVSAAVKGLQVQNLDPKVFEIFENTIQEPTLKSAYISGLKNRIADPSNELDAKEAQEELDLVNKLEGIMIANRIPFDEFNTNQRKEALQLLMQKETLDNQIEGADKVLSKPKQELLDRVNKRLEELTGESIATQEESDTEAEGITQFDSNLEEGEKIVEEAVADIDEFRSLEQDEQIKFLDQAGKELLDEAESRGKTEIQITNAQSLQRAVELFKKDQQTETDTEVEVGADMLVTPAPAPAPKAEVKVEEQEDITEFFKDELGDSISPNLSINKEGKPENLNNLKPRIIKIAKASAKAIAKLLPKTKIVLHESKSEYFKYTGTKGRGYYDTTTDTIHIDLTNATLSTAPHEVFHAVFLNKLKTDAKARAMAIKMVESVKKTLSKNSKLYKEIDAFSKLYTGKQEQFQEEEFIAELIGLMSSQEFKNYKQLKAPAKYAIVEFLKKIAKKFGIKLGSEFGKDDQSVIDLINVLATKTVTGEEITEGDVDILNKIDKELDVEQEQGESGQVGTFTFEGRESKAPNIDTDTRAYAKNTIQKDLRVYEGQNFVTNMYDFTDSGKKDIGGGIVLDLYGGKNYVALMMEKTGTKPGQVSNLAAFNSKENAEGFIKNAIEGDANLFSPHVGTKEGSWQFQQNIFAQLTEKLLDNNVITNEELIESFNSGLTSKDGKEALKIFNEKNKTNLTNLNDFIENPKKLVELLDIDNNYSPDLRKILNDKIAANKKVQEALGVKNKIEFAEKLEDPMNVGSKPFDLIGFIEFDNTTFEAPSRPKKGDADYHPSFAWTVKAKIKAIVQPTNFYQSTEATDSYTKFNKDEVVVSTKTDLKDSKGKSVEKLYKIALKDTRKYRTNKQGKKVIASGKAPFSGTFEDFQKGRFKSSNVSSSAGSGPKVATVKSEIREGREQQDAPQSRKQKAYPLEDIGKWYGDADYKRRGGELVYMTPDEFLSKAKPLKMDEDTQENIDDLVSHIEDGRKLDPLTLYSLDKTDVRSSDGRHRAYAAKELNINSVPVVDFTNSQSRKQQDAPSIREQKSVSELESNLEKKYDVTLDLYQNKDFLELDKIIVTEDQRNTGVGSNVMREVIDFANKKGLTIALTPSTSYGATSIDRLKGFYKGLGFVENKGINKDFTTKQSMLKLPEVKGRESKIPVTIPADLDQQIDELKVRIEVESVIEFEKDKAGKEAYTKKFFDNYQLLKDELKTLELLKEGLVPAYSQRVTLAEKLNDLNKPFMKEVGNEFYPRQGTVKKGKKIKEDKDLGGVFEVDASGYLFRGVSRADFNRVRSTGIIDTDLRGAISEKEGINLAPNASTAFNYLPEGVEGVVMAIKVDKDMDLFMIGADDYVRSAKPIPYQNVKVITTPTIEGRYLEIKNNEVFKLRDYSVNKEVQVNPKKEKTIYDIADSYYYNNGYFEAKPAPDLIYLRREVESVPGNYSVKKDSTGGLFLTQNNRIKKNLSRPKGREQKSTQQIINEGRQANFKESNIRDFLVRVLNRPAKEVDELMSLDKDFLEVVPKSFTNIKGGIKAGTKLYNRVEAYRKKLVKKNDKLKDNKKLTKTQIVDKTIEYLQKQPEYINEGDKYTIGSKKKGTQETRVRKGFSTQQARMLADYTNTAGVRPTNNMGAKIRKAMAAVRQKVKGAIDLQKQKTALRNFIRQSLPKALYTKKEAIDLVNKVNDVNAGNIENLMKEVIEFVNKTNVKSLQAQIKSILNKKYSKVENGIKKPVKISDDIRKRIDFINSLILNEKSTPAQIGDALIDLQNRFNQLAAEVNQTEDTRSEMVDLELAMMYINTLQFKDTNETKVEQLDNIVQTLKEMIEDGRSQLREQIREQHLYYLQQFELGYEAITGNKIDMNDPEASDELNKMKKIFENEKAKRDTQNVIKKFLRSLKEGIDRKAFGSAEDLFSLMDRLDKLPGEMYGGNLQEMFTERVDEASRLFKGRMMLVEQLIQEHLKEVYGKNWKKQSRQNRLAKDTGIMIQDGLPLSPKSQNQIAYLYNLYKDPANKKSFANPEMYGIKTIPKDATKAEKEAIQAINEQNAERIMNEMIALLDPKVKETADWQVNELYPFLYNHYNDAYKKLYRTDLPWNEFYSGTIYREGVDQEEASILDLQNSGNIYSTAVGASGTKVRENSNKAIQTMDIMDVLNTYLNQMEYFSAYGEVVRDMSKLFNNKYISDAITNIHGKDVYKYTLAIIDKIASRGTSTSFGNTFINAMNNVFILSRLAISPVIMIKQLTSFITYANDIGPLNYLKYAAKNKVQMMSVYKEIRDNSVYMKDRQSQSIMRAIETYSDANMRKFVPAGAKDWIVNFAMWTTKFGDKSAIYIGGMPNYSYYKAQFKKKNPEATEQEAIDHAVRLFERDTKRTQQSGDLQDKDYYQTKDPLYRGLNMFLTTPKQYLRKEIVAIRNLNRKLSQWDSKAGKGTVAENLRTFFMYHVIMPVFFQYVSMGLPGILRDERDDDKLDLLRAAMIGNLNALFIVGDLFQMAGDFFTGKPWAGSNIKTVGILSIAGALTEKFAYAGKLKDPTKKSEAYQKAYLELATLTGVAAPTIAKFVENYGNIGKDGDIGKDILRLLNFSKYQIEGPGKGGRPKKIKTIQELNEEYDKKKAKEQKSITGSSNIFGPSTRRKSKSSSKIF